MTLTCQQCLHLWCPNLKCPLPLWSVLFVQIAFYLHQKLFYLVHNTSHPLPPHVPTSTAIWYHNLFNDHKEDMFLFQITKAKIPKGRNGNCPGHDLHGSCCDCGNNDIVRGTCNGFKADGTCCPANQTIDECCICGKTNFTTNTYHCYPQRSDGQCCHDHEWYVDLIDLLVRFDCCECGTHDDNFHRTEM